MTGPIPPPLGTPGGIFLSILGVRGDRIIRYNGRQRMRTHLDRYRFAISTGKRSHSRPRGQGTSILLILIMALTIARPTMRIPIPRLIWTYKPVLGYFLFTASLVDRLPGEVGLTASEFKALRQSASRESQLLQELAQESLPIILDTALRLDEKRTRIAEMGYNQRVRDIIHASRQELIFTLGPYSFTRLSRWIEQQWQVERRMHGLLSPQYGLRTYRVYATRYDSGGAYTVALPDKCLKFANGGSSICNEDGYVSGYGYTVFISYESSTAASVNESGPWNVDDNYWATTGDPTPRRMFADLALGMPEAQAAYFDGYNGGADQFGREVTAPYGIDLARQVSIDIGLEPGKNDWIDVSFMWTEGWDGAPIANSQNPGQPAAPVPTLATILPVEIASANPDGSLVHVVQEGQTLWNIAAAYQIDINQILSLNGMVDGSLIVPGQRLLIKPASLTPTAQATHSPTSALITVTPRQTLPPTRPSTEVAQLVQTPSPVLTSPSSPPIEPPSPASDNVFVTGILILGAIGALLFLLGQWLGRKK